MVKPKLVRITTVPISLDKLIEGQLRFMSSFYNVIAASSGVTDLKKVGKKEGVATFHLEMTRKITPIRDCVAVIKLVLFLRKEKPLLVHTHIPQKQGLLVCWLQKLQVFQTDCIQLLVYHCLKQKGLKGKCLIL